MPAVLVPDYTLSPRGYQSSYYQSMTNPWSITPYPSYCKQEFGRFYLFQPPQIFLPLNVFWVRVPQWGVQLSYAEQAHPNGIAEAFIIGANFIGSDPVALILGDNLFYGADLDSKLKQAQGRAVTTATIFGCHVENPQRYGVIAFDQSGKALSIEEKPITPKSNYAVVGLYFYPNSVVEVAKQLAPSSRGELEITDVNQHYLEQGNLQVEILGQGHAWLDTGTHESLMEATQFIQTIENRQGLKIGCLEEIAFKKGFISRQQLLQEAEEMKSTPYGQYLIHRYDS